MAKSGMDNLNTSWAGDSGPVYPMRSADALPARRWAPLFATKLRWLSLAGLLVGFGAAAQDSGEPIADDAAAEQPAPIESPALPADAALERHFPASQLRRLGEGQDAFLALLLPAAQPQPRGAVLLVGDRGEHADWPELIGPARRQLSEAGWTTLAIGLPEEPPPLFGLSEEVIAQRRAEQWNAVSARLQLALTALRAEQDASLPISLIARGQAAYWGLRAALEDQQIAGLVLFQPRPPALVEPAFDQLVADWDRPLLELIGGNPAPLAGHQERALNARRLDRSGYRQWQRIDLRGTPQSQTMLIRRLQGWLERLDGS